MDDAGLRLLRRSGRKRRPAICRLCACVLHQPSPPKRPRRSQTDPAAGPSGGLGPLGGMPHVTQCSSGFPAVGKLPNANSIQLLNQPSVTSSSSSSPFSTPSNWSPSSTPSNQLSSQSVISSCMSTESQASGSMVSSPVFGRPASVSTSGDGWSAVTNRSSSSTCGSTQSNTVLGTQRTVNPVPSGAVSGSTSNYTVEVSAPDEATTRSTQFLSTKTKTTSAPVVASLIPDREQECSASAPPSLFPLLNQTPETTSSRSPFHTPTYSFQSSTSSNQLISLQSVTSSYVSAGNQATNSTIFGWPVVTNGSSCTSTQSNTVLEAQRTVNSVPSGSQNFNFSTTGTSNSTVFGWPAVTNGSSRSTCSSTQSNTVLEAQRTVNSVSSGSQNFNFSTKTGTPSSTSYSTTTSSFFSVFGVQSSSTFTQDVSTQTFGSVSSCSVSSTFPFQFANGTTSTHSSVDISRSLGAPAWASTNCQTPVTTCWRWHSTDAFGQASSTLTRSPPTTSSAESGPARRGLWDLDPAQPTTCLLYTSDAADE